MMLRDPGPAVSREGGFTVVELLVSLIVVVEVLLAVLLLFDFSNRLSRAQINVSDMQQALRVSNQELAKEIRMAGAGGLPMIATAPGGALWMVNNVAAQRIGGPGTPEVLPGTDILTVRGVFSTPLYHVDPKVATTFTLNNVNPALATSGTVQIRDKTPTQIPQNLAVLIEAVNQQRPEALILISPRDSRVYSVVELNPQGSNVVDPTNVTIAFWISGTANTPTYRLFSPGGTYHPDLSRVAFVGILEEHRFYIREEHAIPNNKASELTPRLSRARTYPGLDIPWKADAANWGLDIADNVLDMQIAQGLDSTNGGGSMLQDKNDIGDDDRIFEAADGVNDDWLYNTSVDVPGAAVWINARLHYLRISLLAKTDRRDPGYEAPILTRIEDRDFATTHPYNVAHKNGGTERMFRRRVLRTLIDLRNM